MMDLTEYGFEVVARAPQIVEFVLTIDSFRQHMADPMLACAKKIWPNAKWTGGEFGDPTLSSSDGLTELRLLASPLTLAKDRVRWITMTMYVVDDGDGLDVPKSVAQAEIKGVHREDLVEAIHSAMSHLKSIATSKIEDAISVKAMMRRMIHIKRQGRVPPDIQPTLQMLRTLL